jgi:hypothetical protein
MVVINSVFNLIANVVLFSGGMMFYYYFICRTRIQNQNLYYAMKVLKAMLITGSLARVLFDMNVIYVGSTKSFNIVEAIIALFRNFGLGGILIFLINKYK